MLDLIRREPAKFSGFANALVIVLMDAVQLFGLPGGIATGMNVAFAMGIAWYVAAVSVPVVKMTDAAIAKAASMTPADIAKVAEVKAEAKP